MKVKGILKTVIGDVTNPQLTTPNEVVIIPHCCNTLGVMGAGVALALKKKWPNVYKIYKEYPMGLGEVSFVDVGDEQDENIKTVVANMIGQYKIRSIDNPKPVRYLALAMAMAKIVEFIGGHGDDSKFVIHCPKFGSELAGGNFEFILELIREIWLENGIDVVVYEFE
ncbi:MAG: hypothetical protein J7L15_08315 [Clostridiales bacterium]|nr:hypothetical protein [Clostridiales bacterium]